MKIELNNSSKDDAVHQCNSKREGDWLIFTCPACPTYERRLNVQTQEMRIKEGKDPFLRHTGSFVPVGLEGNYSTLN